jgi:hypothetical protein
MSDENDINFGGFAGPRVPFLKVSGKPTVLVFPLGRPIDTYWRDSGDMNSRKIHDAKVGKAGGYQRHDLWLVCANLEAASVSGDDGFNPDFPGLAILDVKGMLRFALSKFRDERGGIKPGDYFTLSKRGVGRQTKYTVERATGLDPAKLPRISDLAAMATDYVEARKEGDDDSEPSGDED